MSKEIDGTMADQPLAQLKVLDLTHYVAGPYCTKLMAGFGAEVIKIERLRTGDPQRGTGPFVRDETGVERSIPFLWLNTGKKSITLNLKSAQGVDLLTRLVEGVDVLVENFSPRVMPALGLDYQTLREVNPRLVMTSISNFGQSGPYRDHRADEITLYAMSGAMHLTGDPEREPLAAGPAVVQYTAGMWAYIMTLSALSEREAHGIGQHVDVSIQECALDNIEVALIEHLHLKRTPTRKNDRHAMVPWELYPCRDGRAAVIGGPIRHWLRSLDLYEEPALANEKFRHAVGRIEHRDEFEALLQPWLTAHAKNEIFHAGQARKLAFGYLAGLEEALASPQHESRRFFVDVDHPAVGRGRYCGAPFRLSKTPWQSSRAPLLGEHNEAVLGGNLACPSEQLRRSPGEGVLTARLPLSGVRVIDLTHYWSGPHATRILADLGAEVIRVEYPRRLCVMRGARVADGAHNRHPRWFQVNRNKQSLTLDLKARRDREIFLDLVRVSDVVAENSRCGVMAALKLGYEDLRRFKPDLIHLSMPAYGSTGPWAHYAGVGGSLEPLSGAQSLTTYAQDDRPMRIKEADVTSGILGACAVMTTLHERRRTGRGQWVDLSQFEALSHVLIGEHLLERAISGKQTLPLGNRHPRFAPQGCYRCKGDDKWVALSIRSEDEWRAFCNAVGRPEWVTDVRFRSRTARRSNHDELDRLIEAWTTGHSHYEAMQRLQEGGIAAGAVLNAEELATDRHLRDRGYFSSAADGTEGLFPGIPGGRPEWGPVVRRRGPDLGEDNEPVVRDLLRRSREDVSAFTEQDLGTGYDPE